MAVWLDVLSGVGSILLRILAFPLAVVWSILSSLAVFIYVLLSPFVYVASSFLACIQAVIHFCLSLEPLYVFITCGALVGGFAGVFTALTSNFITALLGMNAESLERRDREFDDGGSSAALTPVPRRPLSIKTEESSAGDTDWQLPEKIPSARLRGRRRTAGLVSQTIHEEESESSEI